jgi:DNA-binding FadR family transcriptional regulator
MPSFDDIERDIPRQQDAARSKLEPSAQHVAEQLLALIKNGILPFGMRLPPERELAAQFSQSRTTIRQAVSFLNSYGALASRPGGGSFVVYRASSSRGCNDAQEGDAVASLLSIAETVSSPEVAVVEEMLEPEIVRLATIYMTMRDLAKLGAQLKEIDAIVTDAAEFTRLEKDFMMTVCEATHNSLMVTLYRLLHKVRRHPRWCADKIRSLTPTGIRAAQRRLRSLFAALECRDADAAVASLRF